MSDTVKFSVNREATYLVAAPVKTLRKGFAAEVFFSGDSHEMATMIAEAMLIHPWIKVAILAAALEYRRRRTKKNDDGIDVDGIVNAVIEQTPKQQIAIPFTFK